MSITIGNLVSYPVPISEITEIIRGDVSLAKQYAIGKKYDGTDVAEGEEGYHNNSQYYAGLAHESEIVADNARIQSITEQSSTEDDGINIITVQYKDGDTKNFTVKNGSKGSQGEQGDPGLAASIAVNSTVTGAAGTNASVENLGTSNAAILKFTIPKGDKGDPGDSGVVTPLSAFFTMSVDVDGDLYVEYADDGTAPAFYYDSETGNLYYET